MIKKQQQDFLILSPASELQHCMKTWVETFPPWVESSLPPLWSTTSLTIIERDCVLSFKKLNTTVHNVQKTVKLKVCPWSG